MKKNKTKEQDSSNLSNNGNDNIEDNKVEEVVSDDDNDFNSDEDLKKELEQAIEDKKRALAEAENTRRRGIKDLEQSRKYGHLAFAREMLSVVDSLESAVNSSPQNKDELTDETKNFIVGVEMTLEQLKQVFNNHNISKIDPQGDKFDYNVHQAMFEKETDEVEPGLIIEVMQPGWSLHDRLLRPAMVGVSKKKANKD
jgi:molecular chaperone GrpE